MDKFWLIFCSIATFSCCSCNIIPSEELQKLSKDLNAKFPEEPKHIKCIIAMLNHEAIKRNITLAELQKEDLDDNVKARDTMCRHYAMMELDNESETEDIFIPVIGFASGLLLGLIVGAILGLIFACVFAWMCNF
ncbi:hypothetical protein ACKWTF_015556 [Chironomus riparius]